jgi:hypothetical protein
MREQDVQAYEEKGAQAYKAWLRNTGITKEDPELEQALEFGNLYGLILSDAVFFPELINLN